MATNLVSVVMQFLTPDMIAKSLLFWVLIAMSRKSRRGCDSRASCQPR